MIGWAALILWPMVSVVFYQRFALPVALCATILGGYLLLPNLIGINLPVLPYLDKDSIPVLTALVLTAVAIAKSDRTYPVQPGWIPRSPVVVILLVMLTVGAAASVATNTDRLVYGPRVLPGLGPYDFFSIMLEFVILLAPLFLARRVLASPEGQRVLLLALALSALAYTLPALYEVRMSPQFHSKLYGFFQHTFAQHMRGDGFRPVVFLSHGLELSIFMCFAVLASVALFRMSTGPVKTKWALAAAWLFGTLVLTKSLGALLIAIVLLPVALFLRPRMQLLAAACIALVVITYPISRAAGVIPVDRIMTFAEEINPSRALSFNTRIFNEEILLEKASERPLFGWGGWGRHRVFDANDGRDLSITDGSWIIELGLGGWFRYIPLFGLMCWPCIGLFFSRRANIDPVCAALALILSARLVDLIPNAGMLSFHWLIAGALIGRLEMKMTAGQETPQMSSAEATGPQARARPIPGSAPDRAAPGYARDFAKKDPKATPPDAAQKPKRATAYRRPKPTLRYRR